MAGISSKVLQFGGNENKYKFNDGTELSTKEFTDGSELELYETPFRGYDPQIGRFWQVDELAMLNYDYSPYAYANNSPILMNDPLGLEASLASLFLRLRKHLLLKNQKSFRVLLLKVLGVKAHRHP